MKKFLLLFSVIVFLPVQGYAQAAVVAAATDALLGSTIVTNAIYFLENMAQFAENVTQATLTAKTVVRQIQLMEQNLRSVLDVESYDDFRNWYNRQLYLERRTEDTFKNMGVKIGKKNYKITDIEGMAYGMNEAFVEYWNNEFTEEQNREMWLSLGLTPANYAYVQTWKARERNLAQRFLSASSIKNEEYMADMERGNEVLQNVEDDKNRGDDDKMGEKELLALNTEMAVRNNKVLNNIAMTQAEMQELEALKIYRENTPPQDAPFMWPETSGFRAMKK